MPHTLLNVVRHPGNKLRFGVINEEFLLALRAERIRITKLPGLVNDIVVNPTRAYYSNGSIFSNEINNWLSHYYPRTAADPIGYYNLSLCKMKMSTCMNLLLILVIENTLGNQFF